MKNTYRNLALGGFLTLFAAVTAVPSLAQDVCKDVDANTALYKKYTDNYAGPELDKIKTAIAAAEEYIQKYEPCKDDKGALTFADQVNYFKGALPERKEFVVNADKAAGLKALYDRFNTAAKAQNVSEILASGKEILAKNPPETLDINIIMASAAFDEVLKTPTANTYNGDVITYAKKAIELIDAGKTSKNYGAFGYTLKTKTNALGILNYSIGFSMLSDPTKKKDAAVYFYKSSQNDSVFKNNPLLYQAIGANYLDEFLALDKKRKDIIAANGGKDNDESLAIEAMQRGYADRATEAYARAYKVAKADPKQKKEYVDTLSTRIKELYAFRYDGKPLDNLDTYVTTVSSKTLTEPTAEVMPVKEEVPATTPPTSGSTTPPPTPTPATKPATTPATKPTPTTPAKPVSSTTTKPAEASTEADATTATTTKAKAKKPTPKKKGTR